MSKYGNLIFVDCEARGPSPYSGILTEFGAVHFTTRYTFHGKLYESASDPENPAVPLVGPKLRNENGDEITRWEVAENFRQWIAKCQEESFPGRRPVFVSDNVAYDWQWISVLFDQAAMDNPFGHSGRRISDFWAGVRGNWSDTQSWKKYRLTRHDHNPVNDAMGNVEAFARILSEMEER
jgi:hypothetical protein